MAESSGGFNVTLAGDLSKPAVALIERVSEAVGGIAKPWQMVRVAKAEAKVAAIRARSNIKVSEIEERALTRMIREEGKRQENIESITIQATPYLKPDANPEEIDEDWLVHFFDKARLVSNQMMQTLWAKILAGEANTIGSFSKKTIDTVALLSKHDANLFTRFCSTLWQAEEKFPVALGIRSEALLTFTLTTSVLDSLISITWMILA